MIKKCIEKRSKYWNATYQGYVNVKPLVYDGKSEYEFESLLPYLTPVTTSKISAVMMKKKCIAQCGHTWT